MRRCCRWRRGPGADALAGSAPGRVGNCWRRARGLPTSTQCTPGCKSIDQQRRIDLAARAQAQLQPHGRRCAAASRRLGALDAQAQTASAQRAVRPGEGRRLVARRAAAGRRTVRCVARHRPRPASAHRRGRCGSAPIGCKCPACAFQRRGVAAAPASGTNRPATPRQAVAAGGGTIRLLRAIQPSSASRWRADSASARAAFMRPPPRVRPGRRARSRCARCRGPAPGRRFRRCSPGPGAAPHRAPAIRSVADSARRR